MKRRSALFALTATFAAGLLLFSSAQGQGGGEPPTEDPGRLESSNDCIERIVYNHTDTLGIELVKTVGIAKACGEKNISKTLSWDVDAVLSGVLDKIVTYEPSGCRVNPPVEQVLPTVSASWTIIDPEGIVIGSGQGLQPIHTSDHMKPGTYSAVIEAWITECPTVSTEVTMLGYVYGFDFDPAALEIFRDKEIQDPPAVTNPTNEDIAVNVSGDDKVHWSASVDPDSGLINYRNLIKESEAVEWLDEQFAAVSASVGDCSWTIVRKLRFKKALNWIWGQGKRELIKTASRYTAPGYLVKKAIVDDMDKMWYYDNDYVMHKIDPDKISLALYQTQLAIDTVFLQLLTDGINNNDPSDFGQNKVNESWKWNWSFKPNPTVQLKGGSLDLHPGLSDLKEFVDSANEHGFSLNLFDYKGTEVRYRISCDGEGASGTCDITLEFLQRLGAVDFDQSRVIEAKWGIWLYLEATFE